MIITLINWYDYIKRTITDHIDSNNKVNVTDIMLIKNTAERSVPVDINSKHNNYVKFKFPKYQADARCVHLNYTHTQNMALSMEPH
jgi:hypothetical protein